MLPWRHRAGRALPEPRRCDGAGRAAGPAPRPAGMATDPCRSHRALAGSASPAHGARLVSAVNPADRGDDAPSAACIAVAARFVANQPGGVDRILDAHRRRPDGSCTHHAHTATPWPCSAVAIAHAAQQQRADSNPSPADAGREREVSS